MKYLPIFLFTLVILACVNPQPSAENLPSKDQFFGLPAYFNKEIKRLGPMKKVKKTVVLNSESEEKLLDLDSMQIRAEFEPFFTSDINKPAWYDKYRVDTVFLPSEMQKRVTCVALDKELAVKSCEIFLEGEKVKKIQVDIQTESPIAKYSKVLIYEPETGYRIKSYQKDLLSKEMKLDVMVQWQ